MSSERKKEDRKEAKRIAKDGAIEDNMIPKNRRIWNPGNSELLPLLSFPTGLYALWTKRTPPAEEHASEVDTLEYAKLPDHYRCRQVGGPSGNQDVPYRRWEVVNKDDKQVILCYQYQVKDSDWFVIQLENSERDHFMDVVNNNTGEDSVDLNPVLDLLLEVAAIPNNKPHRLDGPLIVGKQKLDEREVIQDGTFRNATIHGQLIILSDPATKSNLKRLFMKFPDLCERISQFEVNTFLDKFSQPQLGFDAENIFKQFPIISERIIVDGIERKAFNQTGLLGIVVLILQGVIQEITDLEQRTKRLLSLVDESSVQVFMEEAESQSLDSDSSINVAQQIAKELNEREVKYVEKFVTQLGVKTSLELKDLALKKFETEPKCRTAGGIFFLLCRDLTGAKIHQPHQTLLVLPLTPHKHQVQALEEIGDNDAVLMLPTGMGKTFVAVMEFQQILRATPNSCCLYICQDRDLCRQQLLHFYQSGAGGGDSEWQGKLAYCIGGESVTLWNGKGWESLGLDSTSTFPELVKRMRGIFITSGCLMNVFKQFTTSSMNQSLLNVSMTVFDEVHHANEGEHNFVLLAEKIAKLPHIRLLGLSASPVSGTSERNELRQDLDLLCKGLRGAKLVVPIKEMSTVVQQIEDVMCECEPSENEVTICNTVETLCSDIWTMARGYGAKSNVPSTELGEKVLKWAREEATYARDNDRFEASDCFSACEKIANTCLLVSDIGALAAKELISTLLSLHILFPTCPAAMELLIKHLLLSISPILALPEFKSTKLEKVCEILSEVDPLGTKTLIRVATRRGAFWLAHQLRVRQFRCNAVVGGSSKNAAILKGFSESECDVLVGTSLVEEGLDIAQCGQVICFSIRNIIQSGKSIIQNAGRARMPNSKLYMYYVRTSQIDSSF